MDLTVREGMTLAQAVKAAKELDDHRREVGLDQTALDTAGRIGFGNAAFEFSEEEIPEVLEEFYRREEDLSALKESDPAQPPLPNTTSMRRPGLVDKLDRRLGGVPGSH